MSRRVDNQAIIEINEAYLACGTLTGAAKATGWSTSTIKKYLIPNFKSEQKVEVVNIELPPISTVLEQLKKDNLSCLQLSEEEELEALWKEMIV